jgi:hypothetical protein
VLTLGTEVAIVASLYLLYRHVRLVVRHHEVQAITNGHRMVAFERAVGLFSEVHLQHLLVRQHQLMWFLDRYYVSMHFTVTVVALVWAFAWHRTTTYRWLKYHLAMVTAAGLTLHVLFPLAPPRMFPEFGFIDTLARYGPNIYPRDPDASLANQFAAMPSLHFGWAVIVAIYVSTTCRQRWARLIWLHPGITLLAITATANHYWADAAVAGVLVAGGYAALRWRSAGSDVNPALRPAS